jgi:hypothetical protein
MNSSNIWRAATSKPYCDHINADVVESLSNWEAGVGQGAAAAVMEVKTRHASHVSEGVANIVVCRSITLHMCNREPVKEGSRGRGPL